MQDRIVERNRRQAEEKADYERCPVSCLLPGCKNKLSFGQFTRGHKFCSAICARESLAAERRGKPRPHATSKPVLPESATWEGKSHRLQKEDAPHFEY